MRAAWLPRPSLAAAWLVSRAALVWAALSPWYGDGTGTIRPWSDVELYAGYAERVAAGALPYVDVAIEYPIGALPLVLGPAVVPALTYLQAFVASALLLDLLGLVALLRLRQRWGSVVGPWVWLGGVALLGPVALLRLDLLPVVAVLWALERAAAGRWAPAGAVLAFGGLAKLWPGGFVPAAAIAARERWWRVAVAALATTAVVAVAAWPVIGAMLDSAALRNLDRGLQVETTWATALLALDALGLVTTSTTYAAGADQINGPGSAALLWLARTVPLLVVLTGAWLARPTAHRAPARGLAHALEAATLLLVAAGSVLSAQFVLWALGAVAAVACGAGGTTVRRRVLLVGIAALLTAVAFPWLYEDLKVAAPLAVTVVAVRNGLLVAATVDAVRDALRAPAATSSVAEQ